ncbi:MAG: SusD/RagB family nutrient-binding outer membrane lipoprotein [Prolixibacteraceae bacterium]
MKYKIFSLLLSLILLSFTACDTWDDDINIDKNRPVFDENMTPQLFVTSCLAGIYGLGATGPWETSWNVLMPTTLYNAKSKSLSQPCRHRAWHDLDGNVWPKCYQNLKNIKLLRQAAIGAGDGRYEAVADIWETYIMYIMTLLYGDLPYFGAIGEELIYQVEYDKQSEIIPEMLNKLKRVNELIKDTDNPIDAETDWIYAGDIQKWRKFANVLRFKLAMYYHNAKPAEAESIMKEIINNPTQYPVFSSVDDNCNFNYDGVNRISPFFAETISSEQNLLMSNVFIERLLSLYDPRIYQFAKPVQKVNSDPNLYVLPGNKGTDKYIGHLFGITTSDGDASIWNGGVEYSSRQATDWFRPVDANFNPTEAAKKVPLLLSHYPEFLFCKAEAALKGWISGDAKSFYEQGIRASFDMFSATFTDARYAKAYGPDALSGVEAYLSQPQVSWNGGRNQQVLVAEQKWIASYQMLFEPFFDHRRTMLPGLVASDQAAKYESTGSGTRFPARADYPSSETEKNYDAVMLANATAFDIPVTGETDRTEARMWILNNTSSPSLQMPIFNEPLKASNQYPGQTNFKAWYDANWNSMFYWLKE